MAWAVALGPGSPTHRLSERAGDRETDARSAERSRTRRVDAIEALEDLLALILGQTRALVGHTDHDSV